LSLKPPWFAAEPSQHKVYIAEKTRGHTVVVSHYGEVRS
jgi:hypothetical protein